MATVRKHSVPAKLSRAPSPPALSLVTSLAPAPCTSAMHLPHGRAMSGQLMRALLAQYRSFREAYHAWLRYEDEHSLCTDPVELARRAELDTLTPEAREGLWPESAWRNVLEGLAAQTHVMLVRAVLLANGQLRDFQDLDDDGSGLAWKACAVEVDGQVVAVAPYVYEGESSGGTVDRTLAHASLVIVDKPNVVALGSDVPIGA